MSRLLPRPIDADPALLAVGTVLAFDAALANTGWSVIRNDGSRLEVLNAGCERTCSQASSHEKTFQRAEQLLMALTPLIASWGHIVDHVVVERPAVAGHRIESALMAAFAVHHVTEGRAKLVSRTHVLSLLLGPAPVGSAGRGRHSKAAARDVARRWIPERGAEPFNEHIADAELLGIAHLFDLAHGGAS